MKLTGVAPLQLWRWALIGGYAVIAGINMPGQMSYDSVIALAEGRSGQRITWGPPMYSAIVGAFDHIVPGTGLYLAASLLLLFGAWATMRGLRPTVSWLAPIVVVLMIATPQILIYQGTVWKDVLFANLSVAAFVAIACAADRWDERGARWAPLAIAAICLAFGALVRQNGAITMVFAGLVLGWTAKPRGWRHAIGWAVAGIAVPLLLAAGLALVTPVREAPGEPSHDTGVRLVQAYDVVAALAADPKRDMPFLDKADHGALQVLRRESPKYYSPIRSDTLDHSPALGAAFIRLDNAALRHEWFHLIASDPVGYAAHRLAIYRWVFLTPDIDQCLPFSIGVDGPPNLTDELGLKIAVRPQDQHLYNYGTWWIDTPLYSHALYVGLGALAAGFLLLRRQRSDVAIAALALAGLAFAASFIIISLACDYRYLYFLDLSAMTAVIYVAIDPRLRPRPSRPT
jgi:hypothetical protein